MKDKDSIGIGTTWTFHKSDVKPEPYNELLLKECTSNQMLEIIDFLNKNILLLECECQVLDLYSIKIQPERLSQILKSKFVDLSWMPYGFNKLNRKRSSNVVPKPMNNSKRKMSTFSTVVGSMYSYSVVKNTNKDTKEISIDHMIKLVNQVDTILDLDFGKVINVMIDICETLRDQIQNIEIERQKTIEYIENYRFEILVSAVDPLTKRISSEKYKSFIKYYLKLSGGVLCDLRFKIAEAKNEHKFLKDELITLKKTYEKITETDYVQLKMFVKNLILNVREAGRKEKILVTLSNEVGLEYLSKKYKLENSHLELDLKLMDKEINYFKSTNTTSIQELTEKSDDTLNTIDGNGLKSRDKIKKRVRNYMEVKNEVNNADKRIKSFEKQINRLEDNIRFYSKKLKIECLNRNDIFSILNY